MENYGYIISVIEYIEEDNFDRSLSNFKYNNYSYNSDNNNNNYNINNNSNF